MSSEDDELTAADVARKLKCSQRYAYDVMKQMEHQRYGPRCIRVRPSVFNAWRAAHAKVIPCDSTNAGGSGGLDGPSPARSATAQRSATARETRRSPSVGGSENEPIRPITPRIKRLWRPAGLDS